MVDSSKYKKNKYVSNFFKILKNDEELLRYLYYVPSNLEDYSHNPLSSNLTDILSMSKEEIFNIVKERLITAPYVLDLVEDSNKKINRICMYLKNGGRNANIIIPIRFCIDVFSHIDYMLFDTRPLMILDRVKELINDKRIIGIGKIELVNDYKLIPAPEGYIGYRIEIEITDFEVS